MFSSLGCLISAFGEPFRGYIFVIGTDGTGERGLAIVKVDETDESLRQEGYFEFLTDEQSEAVAGVGGQNHLRGECRTTGEGVELTMFLDGKQVGSASDPNGFHPFDGFAFLVVATKAGTDVRYDNFIAEEVGTGDSE